MLASDGQIHIGTLSDTTAIAVGQRERNTLLTNYSLSVILPAHNEEAIIAETVDTIVTVLTPWVRDFEVIVVNDGSKDNTRAIVEGIVASDQRVRIITHPVNQGYGAALVSGFTAVTKDLAFFTDSDGQFDIRDLSRFFPLIEQYDAVLGYRINRQDTWMRKLNAWGWKMLVSCIFHVHVRDVDCAFKLYRADFFRQCELETRGAMINTEILYKLQCFGYSYTQIGVHHLPRTSGKATGAKLSVIVRAFRELFTYAYKWYREAPGAHDNLHSKEQSLRNARIINYPEQMVGNISYPTEALAQVGQGNLRESLSRSESDEDTEKNPAVKAKWYKKSLQMQSKG